MVVRSSVEAEFRSMAHSICELLLAEVGFQVKGPMSLYYDNKVAIRVDFYKFVVDLF